MSDMYGDFKPIPIKIESEQQMILCAEHENPSCIQCLKPLTVLPPSQFEQLNVMSRALKVTKLDVPPPPNVLHPQRTVQINKLKEEGNTHFRQGNLSESIRFYSLALELALSRPPWESSTVLRDETAVLLCNRSAAFMVGGQFIDSFADADAVVKLKRPWSKGHFRRGKALIGLGKLVEAREALETGLAFEPDGEELKKAIKDLEVLERGEVPQTYANLATQQENLLKTSKQAWKNILETQKKNSANSIKIGDGSSSQPNSPVIPLTPGLSGLSMPVSSIAATSPTTSTSS